MKSFALCNLLAVIIVAFSQGVNGVPAVSSTTSSPVFLRSGQTIRAELGDTVRLPCEVENLGNYVVVWKRDSTLISAGSLKILRDDRIRLIETSLEISRLTSRDSGSYSCEINTEPVMNQTIHLDVLEPPRVRRFPEDGRLVARKGESVTLECFGEGNPHPIITWTRPGRLLPNGAEVEEGPALTFDLVGRQQAGKYSCSAENGVGEPATAFIDLHVLYPPEIEVERNWIHTGVGQEAYLTCIVHAEPLANVLWYRDERVIVPSDNRILESNGNKNTLILRSVDESDFGTYACVADNNMGKSSQIVELSGRPSRAVFRSDPVGRYADSYNLTWSVDSYAPVDEYRLMFRKLQTNESEDEERVWHSVIIPVNVGHNQGRHHMQSFTVERLDPAAVYEAIVTAKNRYGHGEPSEAFQFYTLGSEYIPNVKNLEAKNIAGAESGGLSAGCSSRRLALTSIFVFVMATLL